MTFPDPERSTNLAALIPSCPTVVNGHSLRRPSALSLPIEPTVILLMTWRLRPSRRSPRQAVEGELLTGARNLSLMAAKMNGAPDGDNAGAIVLIQRVMQWFVGPTAHSASCSVLSSVLCRERIRSA
ncbi:hypothetical protein FA95DRAFT_981541 [Auriscalpium vulgare]|uniref:Uncharacterized protein n=1 Tax=Auriscalpium vulgare TaxID=40419 RepID=A0ACB8R7C7_9AGAM|nr:hypothetical protein FA95DRAFT_981541 [Auriscalpium vulgare]